MQELVDLQKTFFNTNATKDISFRIAQLKKMQSLLKANEEVLHRAIYADFKKSAFENYTAELSLLYHDIQQAIKKVKKWSAVKRVKTNLVNFPAKSYIIPEPLGATLIIGAWNYPYQLSLAPAIAAIAAGNTVILKPSELPVHTSNAMAKLINENFDPSFFKVVEGGVPETSALLKQAFDKIFFTGSVQVGKIVYQAAAKNLIPVTLELGGKSPAIITENCDLKVSVKRLIWAKFLNAGQTCIAPDYVVVHTSKKAEFLALAKKEIEASNFLIEADNYVQIINQKNLERLLALIDKDKVFYGGNHDIENRLLSPTIMTDITFEDKVMQDEIFGPILPVLEYDNLDGILQQIKSRPKPLSCYVFTNDKKTKQKVLNEISFGGGAINDALMHITNSHMGFGGVGESGIGSYHGEYGFKTFSHYKGVLDKPTWLEPNIKYYPHTNFKLKLIKLLFG
ncbi:aldehyde dehydrogenase (NAD+) [Arenibacter nanhaiticus]|uniref:Aldehyde dehydrogenase n=1 Tax=Arenibacter nanhaiticus TaxID=558155 RepID=A0A1M6BA35_9FLAO|nr:aldehyde dehydrogenase [Arenibacter nanhaiticus]SHI45527.1 aldehyde dehydrogenase (NAD+) [Arenibacter nanhaiticus]